MSVRFPNANYPQAYAEADMAKADTVPVNVAGTGLTITEAGVGYGPLLESAKTGLDVEGVTLHGNQPVAPTPPAPVAPATTAEFDADTE